LDGVRGTLQSHGGDIEFVSFEEGLLVVRLQGACRSCPLASLTMRMGVERMVRAEVPEVTAVQAIGLEDRTEKV
ncbi:NifU family protein, partial [Patescibacteria group bacterium]